MSAPEWISAVGTAAGGFGVIFGLIYAQRQLHAWREQALHSKEAEIALGLMSAVYHASEALEIQRSPLVKVPVERSQGKTFWDYRLEKLVGTNEDFQRLRSHQVQARAIFADDKLDQAVQELFRIRNTVATSIEMLASGMFDGEQSAENRELLRQLRSDASGIYRGEDALGLEQRAAVKEVEAILNPKIRMGVTGKREGGLATRLRSRRGAGGR